MSKYDKLWEYIKNSETSLLKLTFDDIERIAGVKIDHSFLKYKKELSEYGFDVSKISLKEKTVSFEKNKSERVVVYVHGRYGSAQESERYKPIFKNCSVVGFDYKSENVWQAKQEFPEFFDELTKNGEKVILIANSIGAYYALSSLYGKKIEKTFLISPIVDMEKLILSMMKNANVSEEELFEKKEILTESGEIISWEYLLFARENPIKWDNPTYILYGEKDGLTEKSTVISFAEKIGASLTIMKNDEHWFHTDEQMTFLDEWITKNLKTDAII